ncbi:MAG: hypothetical protein M3069_12585, partial [Chloroflexota bacterium]|nr:hypothetical protein [Chloroflexota bacterium]
VALDGWPLAERGSGVPYRHCPREQGPGDTGSGRPAAPHTVGRRYRATRSGPGGGAGAGVP